MSNVVLNAGSGGATLGTDTVAGIDYEKVKVTFSTDGVVPQSVDASHPLPVTATGSVAVTNFPATQPVSGSVAVSNFPASQTVAGTVTANQGTANTLANAWPTELTDGTTGPVSVKPASTAAVATDKALVVAISPNNSVAVTGTITTTPPANASTNITQVAGTTLGATAVTNFGTAPAAAAVPGVNASIFSGTTGITNTAGALDVNIKTPATLPVSIAGTVAENLTQVASTVLGVPQTFGTTPIGVVIGTSSDLYVAGTRARSNQTTTAAGALDVNIVGNLGVTNSVTNGLFASITDGTTKAGVIVATTALKTDMSSIAGTATVAAAAGIQKVGISGATGVTLDGTAAAGTSPVNGLLTLAECVTTAPSLTTGQSAALQSAWDGSLFVKPHRRSNTKAATGSIASITAANILAAQAAGIFADLSALVLTVDPTVAVAGLSVNISDGTNTYKFWFDTGPVPTTTVANNVPPLCINFDPPIAATTAATAWTIALSVADATVFYVANFVLQKAS